MSYKTKSSVMAEVLTTGSGGSSLPWQMRITVGSQLPVEYQEDQTYAICTHLYKCPPRQPLLKPASLHGPQPSYCNRLTSDLPSPRIGESLAPCSSALKSQILCPLRFSKYPDQLLYGLWPGTNHMPACSRKWVVSGDRRRRLRTVAAFSFGWLTP